MFLYPFIDREQWKSEFKSHWWFLLMPLFLLVVLVIICGIVNFPFSKIIIFLKKE